MRLSVIGMIKRISIIMMVMASTKEETVDFM